MCEVHVGFHLKISKGLSHAAREAHDMGLKAYQYFAKNPRSLQLSAFDPKEVMRCKQINQEYGIRSVVHAAYPANLAAQGEKALQVMSSLLHDLHVAESCGSAGVVVHFGQLRSEDELSGYQNMLKNLNQVLGAWEGQAKLYIENLAHGPMGTTLEEMLQIRALSEHQDKIGFCLDTCHAFASGLWPYGEKEQLQWHEKLLKTGFLQHAAVLHLNDSRGAWKSGQDLHANIGQGQIGIKRLQAFLQFYDQHAVQPIVILETPGAKTAERRRAEGELVQHLIKEPS